MRNPRAVVFNGNFAITVDAPSNTAAIAQAWQVIKSIPGVDIAPHDEGGLDVEFVSER